MAIQQIPSTIMWSTHQPQVATASTGPVAVDAAGESTFIVGNVVWRGGSPGDTKTISAAGGGNIVWRAGGTVTFNNGSTNLRLGIQDMTAGSNVEDGTFDVYADLVGGTDTINTNTIYATPMETGSKTLTYGSTYAVGFEMTTRGGADTFQEFNITRGPWEVLTSFPYRTQDTGSGPASNQTGIGLKLIIFDDGTVGWIQGAAWCGTLASGGLTSVTVQVGSTPDEYAAIFQVPNTMQVSAITLPLGSIAAGTGDTFELIIYTDPLGTPSAAQTVTHDPSRNGATGATPVGVCVQLTTKYTFAASTTYGVAWRPTSANTINYGYMQPGTNIGRLMKECAPFVSNTLKLATRTNQSGAFSETDQDDIPAIILWASGFDDGASVASGGGKVIGGGF